MVGHHRCGDEVSVLDKSFTCPRCFAQLPLRAAVRFCPQCGLPGVKEAALDTAPMEITVGRRTFAVHERIAVGSVCTIYRCRFSAGFREAEGVFKIARDPRSNSYVAHEADVLRRLHGMDGAKRFGAFLPTVEAVVGVQDSASAPPRQGVVLRMHEEIRSPGDELYTLAEVKDHHRTGLDGRDVAWIWRRLLSVLGFVHSTELIHGAVLPMHVMVEPREHKLVLVDWCCAVETAAQATRPVTILSAGYGEWYKRQGATRQPPTLALDVGLGARCMVELLGGDPVRGECPATVEPALARHLQRCLGAGADDAWRLLHDFDRLIEVMWGKREFRALAMPAKTRATT